MTPRTTCPTSLVFLPAFLVACGGTGGTSAPVAPSGDTVLTETAQVSNGQDIFVINNSSEPIRVTGLRLSDCENIRAPCGQIPVDVLVPAHARRRVFGIRPSLQNESYTYRYTWTWSTVVD